MQLGRFGCVNYESYNCLIGKSDGSSNTIVLLNIFFLIVVFHFIELT